MAYIPEAKEAAREKVRQEAEARKRASREAKKKSVRPEKVAPSLKRIIKSRWTWAGAALLLLVVVGSLFIFLKPGENAEQHYNTAVKLLSESKYDQAILEFDKAIELDPNNAFPYDWWGNLYDFYLGKNDLALADYNRAITLNPSVAFFYLENNKTAHRTIAHIPGGHKSIPSPTRARPDSI